MNIIPVRPYGEAVQLRQLREAAERRCRGGAETGSLRKRWTGQGPLLRAGLAGPGEDPELHDVYAGCFHGSPLLNRQPIYHFSSDRKAEPFFQMRKHLEKWRPPLAFTFTKRKRNSSARGGQERDSSAEGGREKNLWREEARRVFFGEKRPGEGCIFGERRPRAEKALRLLK